MERPPYLYNATFEVVARPNDFDPLARAVKIYQYSSKGDKHDLVTIDHSSLANLRDAIDYFLRTYKVTDPITVHCPICL